MGGTVLRDRRMDLDVALSVIPREDRVQLLEFLQMTGQTPRNVAMVREALDTSLAIKEILTQGRRN